MFSLLRLVLRCPKSQIRIVEISNCRDLKSQSASEIATKIAAKSVEKRVEIATEIAMIRIAAIQIASGLHLKSVAHWASKIWRGHAIWRTIAANQEL